MNNETIDLARQKKVPFRVNRGQVIMKSVVVNDSDGASYDFTDHTAEMYVYNSYSKTDVPEHTISVTLSQGEMIFSHAAITRKREELVYQLWITDDEGYRQIWMNGPFMVLNSEVDFNSEVDSIIISPTGDDITLSVNLGTSLQKSLSVNISSAQILNWHNQEVDLIAAPGVGRISRLIAIELVCRFGTTPYSFSGGTLQIVPCYGSNVNVQAGQSIGTFLTLVTSVDKIVGIGPPLFGDLNDDLSLLENQKISIKRSSVGGSYVGGDGTIDAKVFYYIINL